MMTRLALVALIAGCYTGSAPPPANTPAKPVVSGVTPKVKIGVADPEADGQQWEGWPPLAYEHLPAVSVDRTKVAVVEERDGWGHTATPGVRILDVKSGNTLVWLPLVTGEKWVQGPAAEQARLKGIEELVAAANAELARTGWHELAAPGEPATTNEGDDRLVAWTLGDHQVTARYVGWGADNEDPRFPAPKPIIVSAAGKQVAKLDDVHKRWNHSPRCSSPSFKVAGAHAASRVILFHQKLGRTTHACDGVNVPDDWRVLRF